MVPAHVGGTKERTAPPIQRRRGGTSCVKECLALAAPDSVPSIRAWGCPAIPRVCIRSSPAAEAAARRPGRRPATSRTPAGERDHRDPLATPLGAGQRPRAQRGRRRRLRPQDLPRRLDQEPPPPTIARVGDPPALACLARTPLARNHAEVGLARMGRVQPGAVVDRGHERARRHRPHAGRRGEARRNRGARRERRNTRIRHGDLRVQRGEHRDERRQLRR